MNPTLIELLAAMAGLAGTLLLAVKSRFMGWAFVLYLVSNVGWIAFAAVHAHWGLLVQNVGFLVTSLIGCWVWLVKPALEGRG